MEAEQALVQVPVDVLRSLTTSVENLQKDVRQLQNDNSSLRSEMALLKASLDSGNLCFHLFPKLPIEIRNIIWKMALTVPQLHIMNNDFPSRSKVNVVMQACRETRSQAISLKLPYLISFSPPATPKYYLNLEIDTIWLADIDHWPGNWDIHFLEENCKHPRALLDGFTKTHPHRLKRLAISYNQWADPDGTLRTISDPYLGLRSSDVLLMFNGVEELLIVVGSEVTIATRMMERDIAFYKPTKVPYLLINKSAERLKTPPGLDFQIEYDKLVLSWDLMAERLEKILHHFKKTRQKSRKHEMEGNILGLWVH